MLADREAIVAALGAAHRAFLGAHAAVVALDADEGDEVRAGDVLARLDERRRAVAALDRARADVEAWERLMVRVTGALSLAGSLAMLQAVTDDLSPPPDV